MSKKDEIQELFNRLPLSVWHDDKEWEIVIYRDSFGAVIQLVDTGYDGASQDVLEGSEFDGDLKTILTEFLQYVRQFEKNKPIEDLIAPNA